MNRSRWFQLNQVRCLTFVALVLAWAGPAPAQQEIIVSAAASLTDAFKQVGQQFEAATPGVKVVFNFAASGVLLQQIDKGAPVDVFASADQKTMDQAVEKKLVITDSRKDFVSNGLVLIVPVDSRLPIKEIKDLARAQVARIALGNPASVPAGRYAEQVLVTAGLWESLKPKYVLAETVRQALDYVGRAEVDAGFVFATDAAVAKDKVTVAAIARGHQPICYPLALVTASKHIEPARRFIDFILSAQGQETLAKFGFGKP